jgi:hypothetical protein
MVEFGMKRVQSRPLGMCEFARNIFNRVVVRFDLLQSHSSHLIRIHQRHEFTLVLFQRARPHALSIQCHGAKQSLEFVDFQQIVNPRVAKKTGKMSV